MTSPRIIASSRLRRAARRFARELLICVVLPSALMLSVEVVAQKTDQAQAQPQTQPQTQQRPDEQIAVDINNQLTASTLLHPLNLGVWVHDGVVTLSGTVPSADVRQQAVAFMQAVPGVKSVDDQLTVGTVAAPPPPQTNEQMASPQDQSAPENQAGPDQQHYQGPPPPPPPGYGQNDSTQDIAGRFHQPMVTIPAGTPVTVMMLDGVNSRHTKPGTHFRAVVMRDVVLLNGVDALPRGAYVHGLVIDSRPPGKLKGHPKLALQLSNAEVGDTNYALSSYIWARRGPGKGPQTANNVVGGAAVGTIAGGFAGGGPGALLGAAIGGFGGAGLSALSGGARLIVPPESVITFYLNAPVTVRAPTENEIRSLSGNVPANGPGYGPGPYNQGYPPPPQYPAGPPGGYPY